MDWEDSSLDARRRLTVAVVVAYWCFAVNLTASLAAALILEPGATTHPLEERARYVAEHARGWRLAWFVWMAAAPSLVGFYAALAATLRPETKRLRLLAVGIAGAGMLADLYAEALLAFRLPAAYREFLAGGGAFGEVLRLEDRAALLTGALANGLYTIAGAMITFAAAVTPGFPRTAVLLGAPAWLCGAALSIACLARHPLATAVTMAATMVFFLAWIAFVILALWRRLRFFREGRVAG